MSRTASGSRRADLILVVIAAGMQAALGAIAARAWLAQHNTLQANGRWVTTKTELARGLIGAFNYYTGLQALAGGQLDLGAWHGANEVVLRRELDRPRRIEFDFSLRGGAYLVALFDRDPEGRQAGVRLSAVARYPSAFLEVSPDGGFIRNQPLGRGRLAINAPHRADLRIEEGAVSVRVDGEPLGSVPFRPRGRQRIGFRGGLRSAYVDNVVVTLASGERITEGFDAPAGAGVVPVGAALALLVLNLALFAALARRSGGRDRTLRFKFLMISLTLLGMGTVLYRHVLRSSAWYPRLDSVLQASEVYYQKGATDRVLQEMRERNGEGPAPERERILFVGSSQTWGAGALRDDQRFVSVLEELLNARGPGKRRVECINGGISSTHASDLEPLVSGRWLGLAPQVVVINLSSNDRSVKYPGGFVDPMRRMITAARAASACVVLVKEANAFGSVEKGLVARHREVEALGAGLGVQVLDMHRYLAAYEDEGFLWWDKVHLTPYGQRVVAEKLAAELEPLLE